MIYFLSDTHLGLSYGNKQAASREQMLVEWLQSVEGDCEELFLVGDIFDYWFEYKRVVPKGFVRLLGQLARMSDAGVKINFFAGNHDMWVGDYFSVELGACVYTEPTVFERQGRRIMVAHGDGLGKNDAAGRILTRIFHSKTLRWIFQRFVHPDVSMRFGQWWSSGNRHKRGNISHEFRGVDEPLLRWAAQQKQKNMADVDYFVFGHLHTPIEQPIEGAKIVILGEWIENPHVGVLSEGELILRKV